MARLVNHQRAPGKTRVVHHVERSAGNIPLDGGFVRLSVVEDGGHHLDQALPRVKNAFGMGCGKNDSLGGGLDGVGFLSLRGQGRVLFDDDAGGIFRRFPGRFKGRGSPVPLLSICCNCLARCRKDLSCAVVMMADAGVSWAGFPWNTVISAGFGIICSWENAAGRQEDRTSAGIRNFMDAVLGTSPADTIFQWRFVFWLLRLNIVFPCWSHLQKAFYPAAGGVSACSKKRGGSTT